MTPALFLVVAVAGGAGAGLRYLLEVAAARVLGARLPWGILAVNLSGALALGVLSGGVADATGLWVFGVGLLGGYTTFSAVAVSTVLLAEDRRLAGSIGYAVVTFAGSVALAAAGLALGSWLT